MASQQVTEPTSEGESPREGEEASQRGDEGKGTAVGWELTNRRSDGATSQKMTRFKESVDKKTAAMDSEEKSHKSMRKRC
jgi:hypothetical protein